VTVFARALASVGVLALGLGGALVVAAPAAATVDSYLVTDSSGDAAVPNSLPWAVAQAELDPDHTDIEFDPSVTSITLLDDLVITTDITIAGPGVTALTVTGAPTVAPDPQEPVFDVSGAGPVSISGMTIGPGTGGSLHGIRSYADSLTIEDLSLDGFSDDNFRIDAGSLDANNIVTKNSNNDGLSYFGGPTSTLRNVTATGNGDYGILLGNVGGTMDASDLAASDNEGGIYVLTFSGASSVARAAATGNLAEGVRLVASSATATFTDVTSTGNGVGAPCGCGGPGIVALAEAASTVEITRAVVTDNTADVGAGIYLQSVQSGSTVNISNSTVNGNHALNAGGGLGGGIAIDSLHDTGSAVSITDTTIAGNDADNAGGGMYLGNLGVGAPTGPVTITRTTIDGNVAEYGAGLLLDGSFGTTGGDPALTLNDTTISKNTAAEEGGGLYLYQDPAYAPATVLLTGTTVSGNRAQGTSGTGNGGAIYVESAGPAALLALNIDYSTVAANDPPGIGGVFIDGVGVDLSLLSSILAGNERGDLSFDPAIAGFTALWSLVQDASLAGIPLDPADGNIVGVDPKLGALANNGGATQTMLVSPGSAAYNSGDPAFAAPPTLDQRGQPRVYQRIDMGAVEWQPALALTGSAPPAPEPPLIGLLLLLVGTAMIAFSRLYEARSAS
jgi:hypothetical protein